MEFSDIIQKELACRRRAHIGVCEMCVVLFNAFPLIQKDVALWHHEVPFLDFSDCCFFSIYQIMPSAYLSQLKLQTHSKILIPYPSNFNHPLWQPLIIPSVQMPLRCASAPSSSVPSGSASGRLMETALVGSRDLLKCFPPKWTKAHYHHDR